MILYQYFLLGENERQFTDFLRLNIPSKSNVLSHQQNPTWFDDFKEKRQEIFALINDNLKSGWKIERIPVLEKSIIASAIYTVGSQENLEKKQLSLLINQTINFSKKYLEKDKCGYINKLLDLIFQSKMKKQDSALQ